MADTAGEIEQLLAAHSGGPVDYVAIVVLLNTAAGGHYEERHSEEDIRAALLSMLHEGRIRAVGAHGEPAPATAAAAGEAACTFRLASGTC